MFPATWYQIKVILCCSLVSVSLLTACYSQRDLPQNSPSQMHIEGNLTPYQTITPESHQEKPTNVPTVTPLPLPTSTPYIYTIEEGDTLLEVAFRFGLTLDELLAANPSIDPQFLRVGSDIQIPLFEEEGDQFFEATPVPIVIENPNPQCYPSPKGDAWCYLLVKNDLETAVENLTARFTFYNEKGETVRQEVAVSPLNVIKPGVKMPLVLYLESPLESDFSTSAQIITGLNVSIDDTRYVSARIDQEEVNIFSDRRRARVSGAVQLDSSEQIDKTGTEKLVWVLAVAFGENGDVVGFRRWEYYGLIDKKKNLLFEIIVYSVGPAIQDVEIYVEVQA